MESVHSAVDKSKGGSDDLTSADLLEMKYNLDNELQTLLVAHSAVSQESQPGEITEIYQRIQALEEELLEESNTCSTNELFLKRIQMGRALCDVLFSDSQDPESELFLKRSVDELELASQIKRIHKETSKLQEKLDSLKLANTKLKKENAEMMQKLKHQREKAQALPAEATNNKEYKQLKSELEVKLMSFEIHKNLIQLIVTGMGKDWNQDPELRDIMLKCGEPLNL